MAGSLVMFPGGYLRHRAEIAAMVDQRFWPIEWVDKRVFTGAIRCMETPGAVIGFEVRDYPGGARELHGMFAAGNVPEILELIEQAEAFAKSLHCDVAVIESRAGWERLLKPRGYGRYQTKIMKELRRGD